MDLGNTPVGRRIEAAKLAQTLRLLSSAATKDGIFRQALTDPGAFFVFVVCFKFSPHSIASLNEVWPEAGRLDRP